MNAIFMYLLFGLMFLGAPVFIALIGATGFGFVNNEQAGMLSMIPQRFFAGVNTFTLLACPFFILAGEIMGKGGITSKLAMLANALVGHWRGGLAHVNTLVSAMFASLTGAAIASTSAVGSMLIPTMEKEGYPKDYSAALTAAGAVIGPIIPPSIIMVIYGYVMNVSVGALFLAGLIPGILFCLSMMVVNYILSKKYNFPCSAKRKSVKEVMLACKEAALPLVTPTIIVGGILSGIFSPTEAGAVAVVYSLFICLFVMKTIKMSDLPAMLLRAGITTATVLLIIAAALAFSWLLTLSGLPPKINQLILSISNDPLVLLFLLNVVLLVAGMFLDASASILILGPTLIPPLIAAGVDPVHIGIITCINLSIGVITPPFGLILFVSSSLTGVKVEKIIKRIMPYMLAQLLVLVLITFLPSISMALPQMFGY